jgi:hypothetical protein
VKTAIGGELLKTGIRKLKANLDDAYDGLEV